MDFGHSISLECLISLSGENFIWHNIAEHKYEQGEKA